MDSIPINGGSIFFDKLVIDGHSYPKGADKGGLSFCFYGPDKERSATKEYFYIYQQYPNSEIIDMKRLKKEVNDRNNWTSQVISKTAMGSSGTYKKLTSRLKGQKTVWLLLLRH